MTLTVRNGGAWKPVLVPSVKNAGSWKTILGGFVRQGGVWKQFYTSAVSGLLFPNASNDIDNTSAVTGIRSVSLTFQTDGNLTGPGGFWFSPPTVGIGNSYWVRFTQLSGTGNFSGCAFGLWFPLTSLRSIAIANTGIRALCAGSIRMELSTNAGATVAASARCGYTVGYEA